KERKKITMAEIGDHQPFQSDTTDDSWQKQIRPTSKDFPSDDENDDGNKSDVCSNVSTDDDFYDEMMTLSTEKQDHLIPDRCTDQVAALENFNKVFQRRYNSCPVIYIGSLQEAVQEAFKVPVFKDRRPLCLYIHNDHSVYANLFCSQLLCCDIVIEFLLNNYVFWAWDSTFESNKKMFIDLCRQAFDASTADRFRLFMNSVDCFPLLAVFYHDKYGEYVIYKVVDGKKVSLDDIVQGLIRAKDLFEKGEQDMENYKLLPKDEISIPFCQFGIDMQTSRHPSHQAFPQNMNHKMGFQVSKHHFSIMSQSSLSSNRQYGNTFSPSNFLMNRNLNDDEAEDFDEQALDNEDIPQRQHQQKVYNEQQKSDKHDDDDDDNEDDDKTPIKSSVCSMSESREQILADFQACTGLENMEECIHCLNQYDWNLMNAVLAVNQTIGSSGTDNLSPRTAAAIAATTTTMPTTSLSKNTILKIPSSDDDEEELKIIKTYPSNSTTTRRSTTEETSSKANKTASFSVTSLKTRNSGGRTRDLRFSVEYGDRTENITISDQDTVFQLKEKIARKLNIPANKQNFLNWKHRHDDNMRLKEFNLPTDNDIHLVASTTSTISQTNRRHDNHTTPSFSNSDFPITVLCNDKSGRSIPYDLRLPENTTIAEIKKRIEQLTELPVKDQEWRGLNGSKDTDPLYSSGIKPKATLLVQRTAISPVKIDSKNSHASNNSDDEHSVMEIEDSDNTSFDDVMFTSTREPLIPDRCTNELSGLENFIRVFQKRYMTSGPILYMGSLESAIQGSLYSPIGQRRPLAIYLHHDRSICANVFCSQVLCSDTIVEYLENNYVLWAWDLTFDSNRIRFIESLKKHVSTAYATRFHTMDIESFPLIVIVARQRGNLEVINIIEGNTTPDEVLNNLIQSHEIFEEHRRRDLKEETSRETRENLKRQQEEEYKASLAADFAKQKQRIEDEKKVKEQEYAEEHEKNQRLAIQKQCQAKLPAEPNESDKDITKLKIRLPDDKDTLVRRFRIKDTLQTLFDYLTSKGHMFGEYKLLSIHPRRDLTALNKSDTLEQWKLYPQVQLILETL
ncbi:unnamed protein product, partial [Didymodactylos carnosus]